MSDHEASARAFVTRLATKDFAGAFEAFDEAMRAAMPLAALEQTWAGLTGQVGAFGQIEAVRSERAGAHDVVFVTLGFAATRLDLKAVFDAQGAIAGLFFVPTAVPYGPPSYADVARVEERAVLVGAPPWELPGTLTLPKPLPAAQSAGDRGPGVPAVVLVHGSGPGDRDETMGACKPFRDFALGLATLGIAVLAYDKRTRVHGPKLGDLERFTVIEETVEDAAHAVELLRKTPEIDPARVFIVGHSLGGYLAPRIAKRAPDVRGVVILAGSTRPVAAMMIEQMRYILALEPAAAATLEPRIAAVQAAEARIAEIVGGAPPAAGEIVLGAGAAYWIDLAAYDALAEARALPQPIFVAQAERDYQVTEVDFSAWRTALEGRDDVTLRLYPGLHHAFGAGEGPSRPEEYQQRAEVDATLVRDLAGWIAGRT